MNADSSASDLQKAIDDITKNADMSGDGGDTIAEIEARLKARANNGLEAAMSEAVPTAAPMPNPTAVPVMSAPVTVETPMTSNEMAKVKEMALRDLMPLMGRVQMGPAEKFHLYREMVLTLKDKSVVPAMYEIAKSIDTENEKAAALLDVVRIVDMQ